MGLSRLQGPHHDAQKSNSTIFPFSDDKVMSLLLAFWEDKDPVAGFVKGSKRATITNDMVVPSANISADGKYKPDDNFLKNVAHEPNVANFHTL